MEQGFISLHRKLLTWEWFTDINVCHLFIYCLLRANHKEKKWRGETIKKGSFVTSFENLASGTGLTVRQVRTALNKLKTTNELTHKGQSQYSIITIKNWEKYQLCDKQNDKQMTNERQTNDKQMTTNNNDNNEIMINNDKVINNVNAPNPNNIFNPIVKEFNQQIKEVLKHPARLSCTQCDKVIELNQRIDDFKNTIPTVLQRLKTIQWRFDDGTYRSADVNWLLKDENYVSVLVGAYSTKEELIKNWKPKGIDNER